MHNNNNPHRDRRRFPGITLGAGLGLWLLAAGLSCAQADFAPEYSAEPSVLIDPDDGPLQFSEPQLEQQRELFRQAETALKAGRVHRFEQLMGRLQNYPLYSYLQYRNLKRKQGRLSAAQINEFLSSNDNTVIGDRFRHSLLRYYARHHRWQEFTDLYDGRQSTGLHCQYLSALLNHRARRTYVLEEAEKLWLSSSSQPKSCDPVFKAWERTGRLTEALIWKRIELAMDSGRTRLARHVARKLPKRTDRELVYFWSQIHRKPQLVIPGSRLKHHPLGSHIRLHAVKRMAKKDPQEAIELWQALQKRYRFSKAETNQVMRSIGLGQATRHQAGAIDWLSRIDPAFADEDVHEWLIRSAIRHGKWEQVTKAIETMPLEKQSRLRWQFWWAYAHEQIGHQNEATGIYRYLSRRRNYYGFLAADRLGLPYSFENRPLDFDVRELAAIAHYPEAIRARELFRLGKIIDARREWSHLTGSLNQREKLAASLLAHNWGWHDRAIVTMGKTDYRDDIALRFPLPLKDKVETYSQQHSIETAWTYAIIRRESAFMKDARSSQGAVGLMQIMPGTARRVAHSMKLRYRGRNSLLASDTNIKLGTGYLSQMLKRLDSQEVLATAAYNAGPHRVEAWLPENRPMEAVRWIETIPFNETREYVSNVLAYTVIYQHVMSRNYTRLAQRMPPVPAKNPQPQTAQNTESVSQPSS